jgi:hypothetical protein
MTNETETEINILLNNGFTCPQTFLNRVKDDMLFIAPAVPEGDPLTTEQLSGEVFWTPLSNWEKTLAGSYVIHLVEHGLVPFKYVPRTGRNPYPLRFRIKASYTPNR